MAEEASQVGVGGLQRSFIELIIYWHMQQRIEHIFIIAAYLHFIWDELAGIMDEFFGS